MYAQFLNYKHCNSKILASINQQDIIKFQPNGTVCILTCHRIEFYSKKYFTLPSPPLELASEWIQLSGDKEVLTRIATIATGADSKILGERFIAFQCLRPFLRTSVSDLPFDLIDKTFEIAARVKTKYDFESSFSYDDAAFQLLDLDNTYRPKTLVVIGGGLLGQHIACNSAAAQYDKVIIVTKQKDKCYNDIKSKGHFPNITISNLSKISLLNSFDCVVATTNQSQSYNNQLIALIKNRSTGSTVDFCAVPIISNSSNQACYTMYDSAFLTLVEKANRKLIEILPRLRDDIEQMISELVD